MGGGWERRGAKPRVTPQTLERWPLESLEALEGTLTGLSVLGWKSVVHKVTLCSHPLGVLRAEASAEVEGEGEALRHLERRLLLLLHLAQLHRRLLRRRARLGAVVAGHPIFCHLKAPTEDTASANVKRYTEKIATGVRRKATAAYLCRADIRGLAHLPRDLLHGLVPLLRAQLKLL